MGTTEDNILISVGADSGTTAQDTWTTTLSSTIDPKLSYTYGTSTTGGNLTISGVWSAFEITPIIRFGLTLKFKIEKAKVSHGWSEDIDYTQGMPVVEDRDKLKRIL